MRLSLPVSGMLMNQDMKSNYLDGPVGFMEFTSGPIQVTKGVTTQHVNAQTKSAIAQMWVSRTGSVRLPVTQSGRNDAQGLRSVNAIFHHHYQMSHRPKVVCSCKRRCCPHPRQRVCEPPQHMGLLWSGTIHPNRNKACM